MYGEDPINITTVNLQCGLGNISSLVDFGLSTWDSHCPSIDYDDVMNINKIVDTVSTDDKCNYRSLSETSIQF